MSDKFTESKMERYTVCEIEITADEFIETLRSIFKHHRESIPEGSKMFDVFVVNIDRLGEEPERWLQAKIRGPKERVLA